MPATNRTAAVLLAACALIAACSNGADQVPGTGAPDQAQQPGQPVGDDGQPVAGNDPQDTPRGAAEAFLRSAGASQFGDACAVLTPGNLQAIARRGADCQTFLRTELDDDDLADFLAVQIDESQIEVVGDTATIPSSAFSVPGKTTDDDAFTDSVDLIRIGPRWYVALDSG